VSSLDLPVFASTKVLTTEVSAYFASVGFMFERKGCVRIALAANDDPYLEKVIDQALASTAEDFDEVERSNGAVELKVL
jgi:transcriptional/translational regulatory protein YebC/TACO1